MKAISWCTSAVTQNCWCNKYCGVLPLNKETKPTPLCILVAFALFVHNDALHYELRIALEGTFNPHEQLFKTSFSHHR